VGEKKGQRSPRVERNEERDLHEDRVDAADDEIVVREGRDGSSIDEIALDDELIRGRGGREKDEDLRRRVSCRSFGCSRRAAYESIEVLGWW